MELADVDVAAETALRPAQEDVARGLQTPLAGNHALAMVLERALGQESLEDRRLGLLDLEEERVAGRALDHQDDDRAKADAADTDDLDRRIDEPVAVEQLRDGPPGASSGSAGGRSGDRLAP